MALLAEELVEEWLNRQGYFTIRGAKLGVHEIDMLAVKFDKSGQVECRHIEIQASIRPVSYISKMPKRLQRIGRPPNTTRRSKEEIIEGVKEWVDTKFRKKEKIDLMKLLRNHPWSSELVLNTVKSQDEVELIRQHGVKILWLKDIIDALTQKNTPIQSASGGDLVDLVHMGKMPDER